MTNKTYDHPLLEESLTAMEIFNRITDLLGIIDDKADLNLVMTNLEDHFADLRTPPGGW